MRTIAQSALVALTCLSLVVVVLIQRGKGADMGAMLGGGGGGLISSLLPMMMGAGR